VGYLRFRRSIRIAPGIKLNLGKRGISASVGMRGAHETFHISGRRLTSVGIPGTGISYISRSGGRGRARSAGARTSAHQPAARAAGQPAGIPLTGAALAAALPRPGLFASNAEKRYHEGVVAFISANPAAALALFEQVTLEDPQCVSAQLIAAVCALSTGDRGTGIKHLEAVVQAPIALPDTFAARYLPEGQIDASIQISITSLIHAKVPWNRAGAVLALAEQYQAADRLEEAVGLVQQLHAADPDDPVVRLSLADLLFAEGDFEGVVEVAAPAQNLDDMNLATIHLRAKALLELDHRIAGFETYRLALARTSGRSLALLQAIRYDRALAHEETGQSAKAKGDFERLFALDPTYRDVKARLVAVAPPSAEA
jgi:tetratricopeptide (TPR) repeat protein